MSARIQREFADLERTRPAGYLSSRKLEGSEWLVKLRMPEQTPYQQSELELLFIFPNDYPQHPPIVLPQTEIYHINLKRDVNASLAMLQDDWSQFLNVSKVLLAVHAVLVEPDTQTPLNSELLERYEEDIDGFEEDARATASKVVQKGKFTEEAESNLDEPGSLSGIRVLTTDLPEILKDLDRSPERLPILSKTSSKLQQPSSQPILQLQHQDAASEDRSPKHHRQEPESTDELQMVEFQQVLTNISLSCGELEKQLKAVASDHTIKAINEQLADLNELRIAVWKKYFAMYSRQVKHKLML